MPKPKPAAPRLRSLLLPMAGLLVVAGVALAGISTGERLVLLAAFVVCWGRLWPRIARRSVRRQTILESLRRASRDSFEKSVIDVLPLFGYTDARGPKEGDHDRFLRAHDGQGRAVRILAVTSTQGHSAGAGDAGLVSRSLGHRAIGVIVTTQPFTSSARPIARRAHIRLIGSARLADAVARATGEGDARKGSMRPLDSAVYWGLLAIALVLGAVTWVFRS
jgi:Restriction endonuclease